MVLKTLGVGIVSASLALNNPAGHQLLHEIGLRVAFSDAIEFTEEQMGMDDMSFEDFKVFAPFYLQQYYGDDRESWDRAMDLLSISLCIPRPGDDDQQDPQYLMACHVSMRKEEGEDDLLPNPTA